MIKRITNFRSRVKRWKVPSFLLNKYIFAFFIFAIWMLFFDQNNFFLQMKRMHTLKDAESKTAYYKEQTVATRTELNSLLNSNASLEKFAREKYYMKKPNEDVFVILDK